jgi:hypothetical protein
MEHVVLYATLPTTDKWPLHGICIPQLTHIVGPTRFVYISSCISFPIYTHSLSNYTQLTQFIYNWLEHCSANIFAGILPPPCLELIATIRLDFISPETSSSSNSSYTHTHTHTLLIRELHSPPVRYMCKCNSRALYFVTQH